MFFFAATELLALCRFVNLYVILWLSINCLSKVHCDEILLGVLLK